MDIEELNRALFTLTDSERAYRRGATYDWSADNRTTETDGRPMMLMGDNIFDSADTWYERTHTHRDMPLRGQFLLKRNSRFNPVPEHVHAYMEMSYVYAGSCPQRVNGRDVRLRENQVLLLDANCPHAIGALGEHDIMVSVVIAKNYLRELLSSTVTADSALAQFLVNALNEQADHNRYVRFHSQESRRVRRFFQELLCEWLDPSSNAEAIIRHLLQLILAELVNIYEADYERRERQDGRERVSVIPIIRYIEQNYLVCTQESVAEQFYISPNYVSQLLKKHTGMTYRQAVQAQKLGRAAALLRNTDLPIAEIAHESGYENQSFFYRKFKERYGELPAAYRVRHRA